MENLKLGFYLIAVFRKPIFKIFSKDSFAWSDFVKWAQLNYRFVRL